MRGSVATGTAAVRPRRCVYAQSRTVDAPPAVPVRVAELAPEAGHVVTALVPPRPEVGDVGRERRRAWRRRGPLGDAARAQPADDRRAAHAELPTDRLLREAARVQRRDLVVPRAPPREGRRLPALGEARLDLALRDGAAPLGRRRRGLLERWHRRAHGALMVFERALHGVGHVPQQVEAVRDLDRVGRA